MILTTMRKQRLKQLLFCYVFGDIGMRKGPTESKLSLSSNSFLLSKQK